MDLKFVSTDDLVSELERRHDSIVIAATMVRQSAGGSCMQLTKWEGDASVCNFLCDIVKRDIVKYCEGLQKELPEE